MEKRMITTDVTEEDLPLEGSLRPQTLDEYIGQEKTKKTLKIYIEAAKQRHDALDHVLFYGPPGLGKTTLSGIIANEMGTHMKVTSGPAIEKPGEMAAILNNLQEGDILFVDEIHRLNRQVEEVLYPAMEDFAIDIMIGKGASARSIRLDLPKFTLVGATTRAGLLSAPLRDRFGVMHHLEFYNHKELQTIVLRSAQVLGVEIDAKGAAEIAKRSRGTPRLANRLLKRVRDFAQVKYDYPTDMQPQIAVTLALAEGTSIVTESIFENRFKYADELSRMGANIKVEGNSAIIDGVKKLTGARVSAPDLRAGAALVIAGLAAEGVTVVDDIVYIQRGYENFEEKLRSLGAEIERVSSEKEIQKFRLRVG